MADKDGDVSYWEWITGTGDGEGQSFWNYITGTGDFDDGDSFWDWVSKGKPDDMSYWGWITGSGYVDRMEDMNNNWGGGYSHGHGSYSGSNVYFNYTEMRAYADQLDALADRLDEETLAELDAITERIFQDDRWAGDSADAYRERYNACRNDMGALAEYVRALAQVLRDNADMMEEAERTIADSLG